MAEPSTQSKKLQWKWVGISLLIYVVFYVLPFLSLASRSSFHGGHLALFGGWVFIVAAVAGYLAKGVTIWEPVIAGAGLVFLLGVFLFVIFISATGETFPPNIVPTLIGMSIVFLLSLLGAWFGERAQKLWKTKTPESN